METIRSGLAAKMRAGQRVIAVELDPPKGPDFDKFMAGAAQLQAAGIDALTIADNPMGRPSMDVGILSCKVRRELGLDVVPHLTCRDRNSTVIHSMLLALHGEGLRNVLAVTGDPVPEEMKTTVKKVFQFPAWGLAGYISQAGRSLSEPFTVFGALNINAENFGYELERAKKKTDHDVAGFFTQPVLSKRALENLIRARERFPGKFILGGIYPVVSQKNAMYLDSSVAGISVCREIIDLYAGADREQGEALGLTVGTAVARHIAPYVNGYYLMTPFARTGLMARLAEAVRADEGKQL